MESNLFTPYDKEYMKMAMLKHEETFRQQVYELHRLYQIQKKLMREIVVNNPQNASKNEEKRDELDESSIQLTLGPTSSFEDRRITNENAIYSDSAPTFSSSSSGTSSHIMRTTTSRNFHHKDGLKQNWGFESGPSFLSGRKKRDETDQDEFRRDHKLKQQSPWLFQALSLNMT